MPNVGSMLLTAAFAMFFHPLMERLLPERTPKVIHFLASCALSVCGLMVVRRIMHGQ